MAPTTSQSLVVQVTTAAATLATAATAPAAPPAATLVASPGVLQAYVGLLFVGGQILLPILVITFLLSRSVMRHSVLTNFLITWCLSSLGGCFLFYAGQASGPQPSQAVCLTQVSFTYGAPILTATSGLSLVIKFLYDFRLKKFSARAEQRFFIFLLIIPYIFGAFFGIVAVIDGYVHLGGVSRTFLLCELGPGVDTFGLPMVIVLLLVIVSIIVGELMIAYKILQFRRQSKVRNESGRMVTGVPVSFYARMGVFTGASFLALPTAFTWTTETANSVSYLLQASIPLLCFLVFGTQLDVLRVWAFWRRSTNGTTSYAFWRSKGGGGGGAQRKKGTGSQVASFVGSETTMIGSEENEKAYMSYKPGHMKSFSVESAVDTEPTLSYQPPTSRTGSPAPKLLITTPSGYPQDQARYSDERRYSGGSSRTSTMLSSVSPGDVTENRFPFRPQRLAQSRPSSPSPSSAHPSVQVQGHVRTLTPTSFVYNPHKPLPQPAHTPDMA